MQPYAVSRRLPPYTTRLTLLPNHHPKAVELGELEQASEHQDHANRLGLLASVLQDLDKLAEAEALYRQALEIEEAAYGPEHPETIATVGNLAGLLQENGDLDTAEELYRKVSSWVLFQAQYSDS